MKDEETSSPQQANPTTANVAIEHKFLKNK